MKTILGVVGSPRDDDMNSVYPKIIVPGVTGKGEVLQKPDRLQQAYQLGGKLAG